MIRRFEVTPEVLFAGIASGARRVTQPVSVPESRPTNGICPRCGGQMGDSYKCPYCDTEYAKPAGIRYRGRDVVEIDASTDIPDWVMACGEDKAGGVMAEACQSLASQIVAKLVPYIMFEQNIDFARGKLSIKGTVLVVPPGRL